MITCKEYAQLKKDHLKEAVSECEQAPKLAVIQFGNDPSSLSYIKGKIKDCEEVGIIGEFHRIELNAEWYKHFSKVIEDDSVDAIIVDKPIPDGLCEYDIFSLIPEDKDVDNLNMYSTHHFFQSCTPLGVMNYLRYNGVQFEGKMCTVVGRSENVGRPLFEMLNIANATVALCNSKTDESTIKCLIRNSDMVFTCTNKIEHLDYHEFVWPDIVVDIGLGVGSDGKLHGNIQKDIVEWSKGYSRKTVISGPGGVGLLTRVTLLESVLRAYNFRRFHG